MKRHCKMRDQRTRIGCICAKISVLIVCTLTALVFSQHIFFSSANQKPIGECDWRSRFLWHSDRLINYLFQIRLAFHRRFALFLFVSSLFLYICSHSIPLLLEFQHKLKLESCFFRSFAFVTWDCCKQSHDEKKITNIFLVCVKKNSSINRFSHEQHGKEYF